MQFSISTSESGQTADGRRIVNVRGQVAGADAERTAIEVVVAVFVKDQDSRSAADAEAKQVARQALQEFLKVL